MRDNDQYFPSDGPSAAVHHQMLFGTDILSCVCDVDALDWITLFGLDTKGIKYILQYS